MGTLLSDDGFRVALVVAVLGAGLVWWLVARGTGPLPVAAVTVVATLAGLRAEHRLTLSLVLGLALLGVAAWASRGGGGLVLGGVALLTGALCMVRAMPDRVPTWIAVVTLLVMLPLVPLVELRARRWDRLGPVAVFVAVAGAYVCVPDTEFLRPLVAAGLVVIALAWLPGAAQLGTGAVAALLLWAVGIGGEGRAGAVVGGIACVAALALFPAFPTRPIPRSWWVAAVTTVLLVVWCGRVAGLIDSGVLALLVAAAGFVIALTVVLLSRFLRS